jgi:hypothetical protein
VSSEPRNRYIIISYESIVHLDQEETNLPSAHICLLVNRRCVNTLCLKGSGLMRIFRHHNACLKVLVDPQCHGKAWLYLSTISMAYR